MDVLLDATRPAAVVTDGPAADFALLEALERATAAVSRRTRAGAQRRSALLIPRPKGGMRDPAIGRLPAVQRRSAVRVAASLRAAVITGERSVLTRTVNVSSGGMLVAPAETLAVEEAVRFALDLGGVTLTGDGTVLRAAPDGARAIRFEGLDARAVNALAAFVAHRQRELLAEAS